MLEVFEILLEHLKKQGVKELLYKPVPHIYHTSLAEEDLYALFRFGAKLVRRDLSTTILSGGKVRYSENRRRNIKQAKKAGVSILTDSQEYNTFWGILEKQLEDRYKTVPTHSVEEITRLSRLFPENIKLNLALMDQSILAGVLQFVTENVIHTQYITNSEEGRKVGALDLLFDELIQQCDKVFDFGHSCEKQGQYLNHSLIHYKEGYEGRGSIQDYYSIEL
ncbi:GNAT family N-acetyltransferase [Limibacter armeniacum]|uniref:GNAT family N-acetyltransferase n=1 Tax=Limibacter armeniacum TaxID=466084 RepID=UPI002FE616E5